MESLFTVSQVATMPTSIVFDKSGAVYGVVEVPSESVSGKTYRVDVTNGRCDCPAWKFQKGHDHLCKHLRQLGWSKSPIAPKTNFDELEQL